MRAFTGRWSANARSINGPECFSLPFGRCVLIEPYPMLTASPQFCCPSRSSHGLPPPDTVHSALCQSPVLPPSASTPATPLQTHDLDQSASALVPFVATGPDTGPVLAAAGVCPDTADLLPPVADVPEDKRLSGLARPPALYTSPAFFRHLPHTTRRVKRCQLSDGACRDRNGITVSLRNQ